MTFLCSKIKVQIIKVKLLKWVWSQKGYIIQNIRHLLLRHPAANYSRECFYKNHPRKTLSSNTPHNP